MSRGFISGATLVFALIAIVATALLYSGWIPANADADPSALEAWMAGTSLHASMRRLAPDQPNPVAATDENLTEGVRLFSTNCAVCHGTAAGNASASPIAGGLYQKPPQLASEGVEDDPEAESFWKIKHGIRLTGMPSFGQSLSDREIWTLALFLKHMDKMPAAPAAAWRQVRNWPVAAR